MNDDFGAHLGATLREQAPEQHPSLTLDAVTGNARRIRTRRRGALAGAAALTVALAVGLPYALTQGLGETPAPTGPSTQAPVVTLEDDAPRSSSSYSSWITPADPLGLPGPWQDADPQSDTAPPVPSQVTRLGDRTLVVDTDFEGVDWAWLFDPEGKVEWKGQVRQNAVHSLESAAVITAEGDLKVFGESGRSKVLARGLSATSRLVAVEMQPECIDGGAAAPCFAVVTDDGVEAPPRVIDDDGTQRTVGSVPSAYTTDVGDLDLVAVRTPGPGEGKDGTFCTSLVLLAAYPGPGVDDVSDGVDQLMWSRCEVWALAFGADGDTVVLAEEAAVASGVGPARVGLADQDTGTVRTWLAAPDGGFVKDVLPYSATMWQVSSYSYETQRWSLHSYDTETGEVEQIAKPVPGSDTESPFLPIQN